MVQFILALSFICTITYADILEAQADKVESKIPSLIQQLKALKMDNPAFEDGFNQLVKSIENSMEEEKLLCSGESSDAAGKVLAKEKTQLCFRDLKTHYIEAMDTIFDLKKKYLGLIHTKHLEKLSQIQKKLKADIEKSF